MNGMKKLVCMLMVLLALPAISFAQAAEDLGIGTAKVAIITGTASQDEEALRAAEGLRARHPDNVVAMAYPDSFFAETEAVIGTVLQLAADPDIKAIILCRAAPGAAAAFQQAREMRGDLLLLVGASADQPDAIAAVADVMLMSDAVNSGAQISETASEWGVDQLVHYSFPRHMSYAAISARYRILEEACAERGIEFVTRDVPDPTGKAGIPGAQQFVLDDVALYMSENPDKRVAFFATDCSMQEALQKAIMETENAYYPLPCCPSPFQGFSSSLGLEAAEEDWADVGLFLRKTAARLVEKGGKGALTRFSTWPVALNMAIVDGLFDYAVRHIRGEFTERLDRERVAECLTRAAGGCDVQLSYGTLEDGSASENFFMALVDSVSFADFYAP